MDEGRLETHGPKHHSYRLKPAILILIGLVVGGAIYFAVMAWYFTGVDPGEATVTGEPDRLATIATVAKELVGGSSYVDAICCHWSGSRPGTGYPVPGELYPYS